MHDRALAAPRATRRRRVLATGLAGLTAAGLALSGAQLIGAWRVERSALDARAVADAGAEAAARDLEGRRAELVAAEVALRADQGRLAAWLDDLYDRIDDRHVVTTEVARLRTELLQLHGAVSDAELAGQATAALVQALGTCLDGVSQLLNQVSVGDDQGAARTVDAISPACAAVGTVLR